MRIASLRAKELEVSFVSNSIPLISKGELERDIEALRARMAAAPNGKDLRAKCTRAYLKALLDNKCQSLAALDSRSPTGR